MVINIEDIRKMVIESVEIIMLNEHYHGPLYHFTSLPLCYCILNDNILFVGDDEDSTSIEEPRAKGGGRFISFTRDKNYNIRRYEGVSCRIEFDADEIMRLRNARLYPVNYFSHYSNAEQHRTEREERLYNTNIYNVDKLIKSIHIFVNDITEYANTDLEDTFYDEYYDEWKTKNPNSDEEEFTAFINSILIEKIKNWPTLQGKVFVSNKNIINDLFE